MKFAIVKNNVVVNIAEAENALLPSWVQSDTAKIGDMYDGSGFTTPPTDKHTLASEIRSQRDSLLAASDWTQVLDAPVDQAAWRTYRQALRDITAQAGFPHEVTWPVKP